MFCSTPNRFQFDFRFSFEGNPRGEVSPDGIESIGLCALKKKKQFKRRFQSPNVERSAIRRETYVRIRWNVRFSLFSRFFIDLEFGLLRLTRFLGGGWN